MADIVLCEPQHLYNLLNQKFLVTRLAEINYLFLIDAREPQDYNISHIITAKNAKINSNGTFQPFVYVEIDTMQYVVVYDNNTNSLDDPGGALQCAKMVAEHCFCTVYILKGGFEKFSALYPFLRTEKILYTPRELENLRTYPVEIISEKVYMGDEKQCNSRTMMEDLKIKAVVCVSEDHMDVWNTTVLRIRVGTEADKTDCYEEICNFIDSYINSGSRVLIVSRHGTRRCSAAAAAYVMHHYKYSYQEAWRYVQKCKYNVVFDIRFTKQLSEKKRSVKQADDLV